MDPPQGDPWTRCHGGERGTGPRAREGPAAIAMTEVDVTDRLLQQYAETYPTHLKRAAEAPPPQIHPQAAEMFVRMADHAVHHIGMRSANYEDYTVPITGLALTNCLVACERANVPPSFRRPSRLDPWVQAAFSRQLTAELNLEQAARLRHGIWRCWHDQQSDRIHLRLTRRRRQSALVLLDDYAQPDLLQQLLDRPLQELSPDEVYHALAASPEILSFITKTDPVGWAEFESAIGVDLEGMSALAGFLVFLQFAAESVGHSFWYDETFLLRLWSIYTEAYPQYRSISGDSLLQAVRGFSVAPSEAAKYLIHPPFFRLHGRFLRNPCFLGTHNLLVGLLIMSIRRHERAWSQSLGSSLAGAADTLAAMLPQTARLKVAARRKYSGGDVDLALYDTQSRELLICEVKTVYDKHRTDSLMHRFEEAKVNVLRAVSQLRVTHRAIATGQLTLKQLFGVGDPSPSRVHMAILTWFDPIDVTMETPHEDILSLNFATFLWLVRVSGGDVGALTASTWELRNLWAVALSRPLDLGQPELKADVQVQSGLLDSPARLRALPLSALCRRIIEGMNTADDSPSPGDAMRWISYYEDSRRVLMGTAP